MEVPTHSAKDAKASLSKKSPVPKKSVKKTMQSPYETIRPICTNVTEIEEILKRLLAPAKRISNRIPWPKFKKMTAEERIQVKEVRKQMKESNKSLRSQLAYGMNELISAIEEHSLSSAVMCEDIEPPFMMNFLIDFATIHHVPVVIFPKLRKLTEETLGFSCTCLGVKNTALCDEDSHFLPMHKKFVEIAKEYELPEKRNLWQCPKKEPTENELLSDFSNISKPKKLATGLGEKNIHESNTAWPCINPNFKGYWELRKEKKKKGKEQDKQTRDESEDKDSSDVNDEKLPESNDVCMINERVNEEVKVLPETASKGSECASYKTKSGGNPGMRPFLAYNRTLEAWKRKHAQSVEEHVDGDKGKREEKGKHSSPVRGDGKVSEDGKEVAGTDAKRSGESLYLIRTGKKRVFQPSNELKPNYFKKRRKNWTSFAKIPHFE